MTPRIAIDARKLRDFGIGTYIRNILTELSRLDRTSEYVVLCRPDDVESGEVLGPNFRMVPEAAPTYSVAEQIKIPLALAREGARILDTLPFFSEPVSRIFTGERPIPIAFFFVNLFAHVALPLGLALGLVHRRVRRGIHDHVGPHGLHQRHNLIRLREVGGAGVVRHHVAQRRESALQLPPHLATLAQQQNVHGFQPAARPA
mgnify:CR=1 FL=1